MQKIYSFEVYSNPVFQAEVMSLSIKDFEAKLNPDVERKVNSVECCSVGKILDEYYCEIAMLGPGCGSIYKIISKEDYETFEGWTKEKLMAITWSEHNMLHDCFVDKDAWKRYTMRPLDFKK